VLEILPVVSAETAVKVAVAAEVKGKKWRLGISHFMASGQQADWSQPVFCASWQIMSHKWQVCLFALHPSLTEGWYELGNVHASEEKFELALADYNRARQQRPQDPQTVFRTAKVLAKLNRHTEAIQLYREVIKLNPGFWEAHYELGGRAGLGQPAWVGQDRICGGCPAAARQFARPF
jgi:tetratricopeptide (TPR) repeat protein